MNMCSLRKIVACFALIGTVCLLSVSVSYGQENAEDWRVIQGAATDISVGAKGGVAAVNKQGHVFRYNLVEEDWQLIGQSMSRVSVAPNGTIWGVDQSGTVRRFSGTAWFSIGAGAADIAVGPQGKIYVITNKGHLALFNPETRVWSSLKGAAKKISVDGKGLLWRVDKNGDIARRLDKAWIGVTGKARDIAADAENRIIIVGQDGVLYRWQEEQATWAEVKSTDNVQTVALGNGMIWRIDNDGQILAHGITDRHRQQGRDITSGKKGDGTRDGRDVPELDNVVFEQVSITETLAELSIGRDGSVFGLTTGGNIRRWSNAEKRFHDFPGRLDKIVVKDDGLPMGIGTASSLVEHDGEAWRLVKLNLPLIDLSLYKDKKILALNSSGQAAKLSDTLTSYTLLPRSGSQIAAQKDGSFWLIDNNARLFLCDADARCAQKSIRASDISIGPGGSVFVVDDRDSLRLYNRKTDMFDLIRQGNTARVATGPNDRPWIIDGRGKVHASKYFDRDESLDNKLAMKTEATENVTETSSLSNNSGVQIVQNLTFSSVTIPTSASGYSDLSGDILDITSSADDIVIATGFDDGPCVDGTGRNWVYNPFTKTFRHLAYLQRINLYAAAAADELAKGFVNGTTPPTDPEPAIASFFGKWNKLCTPLPELVTYVGSVFTDSAVQASQDFTAAVLNTPVGANIVADIDISANGWVGNINRQLKLEVFQPENSDFVDEYDEIAFVRFGLGTDEKDIWAVNTSYNVYEYIQSSKSFKLRSSKQDDKAMDIGVGHDGTVYIVNMDGVLKKWNTTSGQFVKTNKTGVTRVAVDSKGKPIVANFPDSKTVYFGR